jgi:hypothetical protein
VAIADLRVPRATDMGGKVKARCVQGPIVEVDLRGRDIAA